VDCTAALPVRPSAPGNGIEGTNRAMQPFDWIDKTFIHVPPPEIKEEA